MTATTKAVILARGLGTRMRQADAAAELSAAQVAVADAGMKAMIPIGRPFMDHLLSGLADGGLTDVCLVLGPEHESVRTYYRDLVTHRVRVHFAVQESPDGTAGAVAAVEPFAGGDTILVLNGDNFYPIAACRNLAAIGTAGVVGFAIDGLVAKGNIPRERVRQFALLQVGADGRLATVIEKPDEATYVALVAHSLVSMNLWSFTPTIFDACRRVTPSARGERELVDAVRIAISEFGEPFTVVHSDDGVLDLSSRGDIESVSRVLRDRPVYL